MSGAVAGRLEEVRGRIASAAARSGRDPGAVTLVAIGKAHDVALLHEAYEAGHRDFGENRAQELAAKQPALPGDVRWHFVGPLQRNKVRRVRPIVTLLHSMDRARLAREWARSDGPSPPVLLEINLGGEAQKAGVVPEDAAELAEAATALGLDVRGLMAIPPLAADPEQTRPYFSRLAEVRQGLVRRFPGITELSMGMTADFEVAVEEGATLVRVGQAIFGPRPG